MNMKGSLCIVGVLLIGFCVVLPASADEQKSNAVSLAGLTMNFDKDQAGKVPLRVSLAETFGQGKKACWKVVAISDAPSQPHAFGITSNKNHGRTYNLALVAGSKRKDLDMSVKVKAVGGEEDQGGGPVWRAIDENNYYIARWNPLEDNFRVYFVKNGQRRQLKSAKVSLDPKTWHTIRVVMQGARIECYLDAKKLLVVTDKTFKKAGKVGLWVKADGQTLFDDFTVDLRK
jgi:hypothetical protein